MDWWLQPSEAMALLLGSVHIMTPICVTGCLVILSLCCVIYTLRQSVPAAEEPALPPDEDLAEDEVQEEPQEMQEPLEPQEPEEPEVDPEDTGSSFPLMPCVPLPQAAIDAQIRRLALEEAQAEAEAARGLQRQDRTRIAKDVLPGFGIVLGIVFGLLLFVVITTLHRADGHPVRCFCECAPSEGDGDAAQAEILSSSEESSEDFKYGVCDSSCRCLCTVNPDSVPTEYRQSPCPCGCVGDENEQNSDESKKTIAPHFRSLNNTLETKDDSEKHQYKARDVGPYLSSNKFGNLPYSLKFSSEERLSIAQSLAEKAPKLVKNQAHFAHSNVSARQKREEPSDVPNNKWEFFSSKNTSLVVVIALVSTVIIMAVCHPLTQFHKYLRKVCAKREFTQRSSNINYIRSTESL